MSFGSSSLLRGDSSSDALTYHRPPRGGMRKETRQRRVVECKVKRRKEPRLDAVIERNKKFRIVQRIQELLGKQEGGRMSLKELGKHRNKIGLSGGRRCVSLIRRFPSIFRVYDKGAGNIWFELTPEAARRDARERELRAIMEPILVDKLCKLLMMSATQSLSVESVGHVRRELGLPEDFKTSFLPRFSDRFRVATPPAAPPGTPAAAGAGGPVLVLQQWDDRLALSVAEANEAAAMAREEVREEAWEEAQKEGSEAVAGEGGGNGIKSGTAAAAASRAASIKSSPYACASAASAGAASAGGGGSAADCGGGGGGGGESAAGGWGDGGAGGAAAAAGGRAHGGMVRREGVGGVLGDGDNEGEGESGEERRKEEEKEEDEEVEEEWEEEKEEEKEKEKGEEEEEGEAKKGKEEKEEEKEEEEEEGEGKEGRESVEVSGVGSSKGEEGGHEGQGAGFGEGWDEGWEEGWGEGGGEREGGEGEGQEGERERKDSKHQSQKQEMESRGGGEKWVEERWEEEEQEEQGSEETQGAASFRKPHLGPVLACDPAAPSDSPQQTLATQAAQVPPVSPGTQLPPPKPSLTPEQLAEAAIGLGRHKAETSRMAYITGKTSAEQEGTSSGVASGAGTAGSSSSSSSSSSREQRYKKAVRLSLKLNLPPGLKLKQSDLLRLQRFHSSPQISPYANPLELGISPESMEAERRAVAVIREFLSLTVEKRCLIDQLTHFRKDFLLPARIYALLLRHPEVFYVSVKGVRDSVFLREAYEGEVLIMSDELADAIEEMRVLMEDGRRRMRRGEVGRGEREGNGRGGSDEESEWESEDEEEWGEEDEEEEEEEEEEEGWEREKGRNSRVVPGVWKRANGQAVGSGGRVKSNAMSVEVGRKGGERGWERGGERGGERGVGRGVGRGETRGVRKGENEGERKWVGVARWGRESGRVDGSRWVPVGSAVGEESEGDKRTGREKERGEEEEKEGRGGDEEEEGEGGEDEERGGKARAAGMRGRGDEVRRERERVGVIGAKEKGRGKESWRSKGIHRQGLIKDRWGGMRALLLLHWLRFATAGLFIRRLGFEFRVRWSGRLDLEQGWLKQEVQQH
ncbi:unnamed protein product [Closterium sp. NIES-64]|nr:unnamed protein product [Closterium sp. NIES-64]